MSSVVSNRQSCREGIDRCKHPDQLRNVIAYKFAVSVCTNSFAPERDPRALCDTVFVSPGANAGISSGRHCKYIRENILQPMSCVNERLP